VSIEGEEHPEKAVDEVDLQNWKRGSHSALTRKGSMEKAVSLSYFVGYRGKGKKSSFADVPCSDPHLEGGGGKEKARSFWRTVIMCPRVRKKKKEGRKERDNPRHRHKHCQREDSLPSGKTTITKRRIKGKNVYFPGEYR